jgi:hypothetical protein
MSDKHKAIILIHLNFGNNENYKIKSSQQTKENY